MAAENIFLLILLLCSAAFFWQSWGDGCSHIQASAVATSPGPVPARKELQQGAGLLLSCNLICTLRFWEHIYLLSMFICIWVFSTSVWNFYQCHLHFIQDKWGNWVGPAAGGEDIRNVSCKHTKVQPGYSWEGHFCRLSQSQFSYSSYFQNIKIVMCMFSNIRQRVVAGLW